MVLVDKQYLLGNNLLGIDRKNNKNLKKGNKIIYKERASNNKMGQQLSSISQTNRLYQMPLNQYGLKQRINWALSTWKNKSSPYDQLIECRMVVNSQEDLRNVYDIFRMRHMHMYLPATRYLTCEQYGIKGCGQYYKGNIYLDSAVANLSLINDIPFIDSLHIYSVALKGFQILFRKFGYFDVFQDMFHICQNGKVKVWCNSQLYKLGPQSYLLDINGREQDMIYRILNIIDQNIDRTDQYNMKQLLYRKIHNGTHFKTFQQINIAFRNVCMDNNWQPPERLKCISQLTKEDIHKLIVQQHCLQKQNQNVRESKGLITINSFNNEPIIPPKQANEGNTSIRVPIQTPVKGSQLTQTNIPTQPNSLRPDQNNNTSLYNLLQNSDHHRIRYYGTNKSINPNMNMISVSTIPPNVDMVPRSQRYMTTRANTPEIRPRESRPIIQNKPTLKILSVQKNAPMRNVNYVPYSHPYPVPPPLPPRLIQTTPQIVDVQPRPNLNATSFVPRSPIMVHNSIKLSPSPSQKELNVSSLSGTAKFIQTPVVTIQRKQSASNLDQHKNSQNQSQLNQQNKEESVKSSKHQKQTNPNLYSSSKKSNKSIQNDKNKEKQEQPKKELGDSKRQIKDKKQIGFHSRDDQKIIKSIILPQRYINSGKSSNRSQLNENNRKGSEAELGNYKSSITKAKNDGPSTFQFEQRFQQSIGPQDQLLSRQKQSTTYFPKYTPTYQRPTQLKQTFSIYSNNIYQPYTAPLRPSAEQIAEYTDPKLLSMLSTPKNRSNIPTNPTFHFNMDKDEKTSNSMNTYNNLSYLNKNSQLNSNQLYYSFSSNKNRENKFDSQDRAQEYNETRGHYKIRERQYQSEANINYQTSIKYPEQDASVISSQSHQNPYKKYQTSIDTQIWKDLIELKKHKNLY